MSEAPDLREQEGCPSPEICGRSCDQHPAEKNAPRVKIDFTVTDDEGKELAWGGTSCHSSLHALADELHAMVERGEFPHAERIFPPGAGGTDV